ncbi:MAG TPA: hypothetical protein PKG52_07905 [bacterium]|nr:hypothetical protein [bacterium]HPS28632.1 hypothetical protein [bacterium]
MKKTVLIIVLSIFWNIYAQDNDFVQKLLNQGAVSLVTAQKKCEQLPKKNQALIDAMANVYKIAKEKNNPSVNVFAQTDYLLHFLQDRINEVCTKIKLADGETIKIIVSDELKILLEKRNSSQNFESFIENIYGTEYSKFLYLTASVSTLEKMHEDWGLKMASERKNMQEMVKNIDAGNKVLKDELTEFTKAFKLYYEGVIPAKPAKK